MKYVVKEGSGSAHCCFEYTIRNTETNEIICECFERHNADLICDAINNKINKENQNDR